MNPEFSVTEVKNSNKLANILESQPYDSEQAVKNYRKLLTRGSTVTKDFIDRVQNASIINKKTVICGYEFRVRQFWVLSGLIILFILSLFGTINFCFTNNFDNSVLSHLVLTEDSQSFKSFQKPIIGPYFRVHIFNYTNIDEYEKGLTKKLKVEDLGPYTYAENIERINTEFNDDGTLTFQEKRSYEFRPDKSKGFQFDRIIVPNLPMISAIEMQKDTSYFQRLAVNTLLSSVDAYVFLNLTAHSFIWGYDDNFFDIVKGIMSFQKKLPYDKFGILAHKTGIKSDKITINTGIKDINAIGTIVKFNNDDKMSHWTTNECNRMDGTDGSFFGPDLVKNKEPLYLYHKELCRKLPLKFESEVKVLGGATSYRYTIPDSVFSAPKFEPENQCFCQESTGTCPPHGIFNATPCALGPAYISLPHFMHGDPDLLSNFEGLNPDPAIHGSYMDIHPTMGFTMGGVSKMQVNVHVINRMLGINHLDMFHKDMFLPVAWFEVGLDSDELPQSIKDTIYTTQFTVPRIKLALQVGSISLLFITLIGIILIVKGRTPRTTNKILERNISGLDHLIDS